jgi:hypothetical protein
MGFIGEDTCLHSRIFVHDFLGSSQIRREDADARDIALVLDHEAHDAKQAIPSEFKVSPTMLPHDLVCTGLAPLGCPVQDDHGVAFGCLQHLSHIAVSDVAHEIASSAFDKGVDEREEEFPVY